MEALLKARARLKEIGAAIKTMTEKPQLTADDLTALNAHTDEAEALEAQIKSLERVESFQARSAVPAGAAVGAEGGAEDGRQERGVEPVPQRKMNANEKVSIIAASTLLARVQNKAALQVLDEQGYGEFAKELGREMKRRAISTTTASVFIPDPIADEFIEFLRPEMTFFQGGPKRVQFTAGKFKAPRGATGATASYVGEGAKKPVTEPTFDEINMSAKKLAAIVLITQEARDWSVPSIDAYIRDDLRTEMASRMDLNAYFGLGTGNSPRGILNIAGVPSFDFSGLGVAPTISEIDAMASRLILSLTENHIHANPKWAWLFSYRTFEALKNIRVGGDSMGVYAYPELHLPVPTWKGFRVLVTSQVPNNLGDESDESTIALIDYRHVLYGEEGGVEIKTSDQASVDVSGTVVHLWQQNMYGILAEHQHDFGLRHLHAVAKATGIRFGSLAGSPTSP